MNTEEERIALEKTHVERDWAHLEVGLNDCTGIIFSSTSHGLPMCARPTCHGLNRTAEFAASIIHVGVCHQCLVVLFWSMSVA